MLISADDIETFVTVLIGGSAGAAIAYLAFRNLRPSGDPLWLLFQRKYPVFLFLMVYVAGFFGIALGKDEVLVGPLHVHSIAYPYLLALAMAVPISIVQRLYNSRHRDAHA